jgi:DNA-3-methyladenine glycosylase
MLGSDFFQRDPVTCARELLGKELRWEGCSGIVVETEAYAELGDEACHTFTRKGARQFVEENEAGAAYVYLNYGMYWLSNVLIKGEQGNGFVLIRALRPTVGLDEMSRRRKRERPEDLCSGPGKLSMALDICGNHHGSSFVQSENRSFHVVESENGLVIADGRVGISKAVNRKWRFYLDQDRRFVSVIKKGKKKRPTP